MLIACNDRQTDAANAAATQTVRKGVLEMKQHAAVGIVIGLVLAVLPAAGIALAAGDEGVSPSSEYCTATDIQPMQDKVSGGGPPLVLAGGACGSNLSCGFNTGCAPGKNACCPRSAPNLNMCNCSCYAKTNYNTAKGGCNVWHSCR